MLKTVKDACELEEGTLEYGVATGVENLTETINTSDGGQAFFQRNYLTRGMEELLREGLIRLAGGTDQAVFQLAQAMGGGKTHLMAALGLLARHPERRAEVLPEDVQDRVDNEAARVAIFDGRESPDEFLWGSLAKQLGTDADQVMRPFWSDGPKPPAKDDWKRAIGDEPTLTNFPLSIAICYPGQHEGETQPRHAQGRPQRDGPDPSACGPGGSRGPAGRGGR